MDVKERSGSEEGELKDDCGCEREVVDGRRRREKGWERKEKEGWEIKDCKYECLWRRNGV